MIFVSLNRMFIGSKGAEMKSQNVNAKGLINRRPPVQNKSKSMQRLEKVFDAYSEVAKYSFSGIVQLSHSFGPDVLPIYFAIDGDRSADAYTFEDWNILCHGNSKEQFEAWVQLSGKVEMACALCYGDLEIVRLKNGEKNVSCFGISHPPDEYGHCLWMIDTSDIRVVADLIKLLRGAKLSQTDFDDIYADTLSARIHLAYH